MSAATLPTLRPMQPRDFEILRRLNSPLYRQAKASATQFSADQTLYSDTEGREIIYQFTHPLSEVFASLQRGRSHFTSCAVKSVGHITKPEADLLIGMISANLVALWQAATPLKGVAA